ncbi:hypothetical protein CEUSTIGMA_g3442.t1 [Chlamydomonas eustigma]|uniref:Peptidoglycan binding-like domain-containing protein n=1 Tax=Chlamydomonas eustigma TaxID=1157962 RepID=A0A250WZ74_9CHLO|nr:hypothetical protein CEUSTIGMA_g3442.t1 [Chlamydomonas eustigma]|eukprot:GAX75999.1 hypothetical protein CEUSTIGMA_g3442.t1 [Chlamydomonas eustigma]
MKAMLRYDACCSLQFCRNSIVKRVAVKTNASRVWSWDNERSEWLLREQNLMRELAATRSQVDKLLEQQQMLLNVILQPMSSSSSSASVANNIVPPGVLSLGAATVVSNISNTLNVSNETAHACTTGISHGSAHISSFPSGSDSQGYEDNLGLQQLFREWGVVAGESTVDSAAAMLITDALKEAAGNSTMSEFTPGQEGQYESNTSVARATSKAAINGFPPKLAPGEDDIYWMGRLHVALLACGCCSWNEEMESRCYGELTQEAVVSFQASQNLPESGVVDIPTWEALFKQVPKMAEDILRDIREGKVPNTGTLPPLNPSSAAEMLRAQVETLERILEVSQAAGEAHGEELIECDDGKSNDQQDSSLDTMGQLTNKQALNGLPPPLAPGEDDIYWMGRLHEALLACGFGCGDDDTESWYFGDHTREAVLTFQASEQLIETGVADSATWQALLTHVPSLAEDILQDIREGKVPKDGILCPEGASPHSVTDLVWIVASKQAVNAPSGSIGGFSTSRGASQSWPVVQEGDGGKDVRTLQACLEDLGFYCGEEDMRWWMFGDTTRNSLMAFQASAGLPQSGVCEESTWKALLGPHAIPEDLHDAAMSVVSALQGAGDSESEAQGFSDDLTLPGGRGVWLLGEQRWEKSP